MIIDDAARLDRLVSRLLELARVEDDRGVELPVDLAERSRAHARRGPGRSPSRSRTRRAGHPRPQPRSSPPRSTTSSRTRPSSPASGTSVAIPSRARDGTVRVTVANHGPALSPAARARVWDRFYSTRVATGGSGLGLAIVRSVALSHGGTVGVDCADGVTGFWFELPAR